ncbi:MAG TPA: SDR family NAD(P)-dependent oxidoreductase [Solirubrobacteraceae bacterium]|nr:SDR family NAD(P)-dependent oxidoreductase [Solirubrobacteraceae bacterium]
MSAPRQSLMAADTTPRGRRVIVTGAGGGIGRSVVETLTVSGCRVAACDAPGVSMAELVSAGTFSFDVRDRAAVKDGVRGVLAELGGCDAVVAGAGLVDTIHRAENFSEADWRRDVETNLYGAFYVAQAAFAALAESGDGRIVLISSVAAEIGLPGQVAYGASKAGLVGLARTLAAEWAPAGIRCNVVMPGMIATPKVLAMPETLQGALRTSIPLGRFGSPEELAGVVSFLLSPAAAYLTGSVVRVDGGFGLAASAMTG